MIVTPGDATDGSVTYASSDESIVSVKSGEALAIEIHRTGTVVITVSTNDGGFTDTLTVHIVEGHGKDGVYLESSQGAVVTASGQCGDKVRWTLYDNGTLFIRGNGKMKDYWTNNPYSTVCPPWLYKNRANIRLVIVGSGVASIGHYAFTGCYNLSSISLSDTVSIISNYYTFSGCENLAEINVSNQNQRYASKEGVLFDKKMTSIIMYPRGKNGEIYTIPENVTYISPNAFHACTDLENINMPNVLQRIGEDAFSYCSSLTSVCIPSSVTSIEDYAFADCNKLTKVTMQGNAPEKIAANAFVGCSEDLTFYVAADASGYDTEPWVNYKVVYGASSAYSVTYNANGGKNAPANQTKRKDKTLTLSKTVPTRTGYTFQGWATSKTATKAAYQPGASYKTNKSLTLYAVWKANSYQIAFNKNGGAGSMSTTSCTYDKAAELPTNKFTRSGYKFKGWNTKADGSGTSYADKASVKNLTSVSGKKMNLYAQWTKGFKVTYNANGGKVSESSKTVYQGLTYGTLATPTRKGYTFTGWYTAASGGSKVASSTKMTKGKNHTIYAHWGKKSYNVEYVLNGGTNSKNNPSSYTVTTATVTLKNPTRKGYTFNGWYTSSNYKTKATQITKGSTGNKTFYAKWTVNKYTIRYNKNGADSGNMTDTASCKYGTSYTLRANSYKRNGYRFIGWNTKADGSGKVFNEKTSVKNLSSTNGEVVELYAQWQPIIIGLSFERSQIEMTIKESYQLVPIIEPEELAGSSLEYSIADEKVATVSEEGVVTAVAPGEAEIICKTTDGSGLQVTVKVIVTEPQIEVTGIDVSINTMTVKVGDCFPLGARVIPDNASNQTVRWSSSDTSVVTIDETTGLVTAVGAGEAIVTATADNGVYDTGTLIVKKDTVQIGTAEELMAISNDLNGDYELTEDIDLSSFEWSPIGDASIPFAGTLEGNNHTISGMSITDASQIYSGLFGCLSGSVENLNIIGIIELKGNNGNRYRYAGGIAGYADGANIINCVNWVSVNVENTNTEQGTYVFAGGIIGNAENGTEITNCTNNGIVFATIYDGIRSSAYAGGIAGEVMNGTVISGCINNGEIAACAAMNSSDYWVSAYAGGISGSAGAATITNVVNNQSIAAMVYPLIATEYPSSAEAGGIVGHVMFANIDGKSTVTDIQAIGNEFADAYADVIIGRSL